VRKIESEIGKEKRLDIQDLNCFQVDVGRAGFSDSLSLPAYYQSIALVDSLELNSSHS
jgi:hypothetical protein